MRDTIQFSKSFKIGLEPASWFP